MGHEGIRVAKAHNYKNQKKKKAEAVGENNPTLQKRETFTIAER